MFSYPCFVLDNNISWLSRGLKRRGFRVILVRLGIPDEMIVKLALREKCIVVTHDSDFLKWSELALVVPREWCRRYNSWDLTTKVVKLGSIQWKKYYG